MAGAPLLQQVLCSHLQASAASRHLLLPLRPSEAVRLVPGQRVSSWLINAQRYIERGLKASVKFL